MVCEVPTCCALAVDGQRRCSVHLQVTRRQSGDAPIHCYACDELIRIGARWVVRVEGAFHARAACLNAEPAAWKVAAA